MSWISLELQAWLPSTEATNGTYRHARLTEDSARRVEGLASLASLAAEAHRDARERLERLVGISLDPLSAEAPSSWHRYPEALHTSVLQGYLGELLAGLIAENYQPHGRRWAVPAFLFRGHLVAYQDLERRRQLGGPARPIPGRTGDDALAFEVDQDGAIVAWLWCEAKCTHDHVSTLISDGHDQLSAAIRIPVDLTQLIAILQESPDPDSERWIASLRELLFASEPPPRFDMFVYVCGRKPVQRPSWIPEDAPHSSYTGARSLEAVEVHLECFDEVLTAAYPGHVIHRG
jgi:hypothetical protein